MKQEPNRKYIQFSFTISTFQGRLSSYTQTLEVSFPLLMPHTHLPVLPSEIPIPLPAANPKRLPPPDHDEKDSRTGHADERRRHEAVLVAEVLDPRSDAVPKSEGHGVPHQDCGHQRVTAQLLVAVDQVVDAQGDATRDAEVAQAHGYHQTEPMDRVRRSNAPED
jgi:hypothetical protein